MNLDTADAIHPAYMYPKTPDLAKPNRPPTWHNYKCHIIPSQHIQRLLLLAHPYPDLQHLAP